MSNTDPITQLIAIAALAVSILGIISLTAYSVVSNKADIKERDARITQVDTFLMLQCQRDAIRDQVIVKALKDAQDRARASIGDPSARTLAVQHLQVTINELNQFHGKCVSQLPSNN